MSEREPIEQAEPSDEGEEILLDHEYDGIREYDNPLPKWWTWSFIASAVFAAGYFFHYHMGIGEGVHADYRAEVRAFEEAEEKRLMAMGEVTEDALGQLAANAAALEKGRLAYATHCKQCHAEHGEGSIGPNLTDGHWIHGDGSLMEIYGTVRGGVLAKGMPAWGTTLSPGDLRAVVAYLGSIRNTNLPGKKPEGTPVGAAAPSPHTTAPTGPARSEVATK
jgi:cytochrome c oxidase cbb3-type subunit III